PPPASSVIEELLEFGASGGDPEIVRMALERVDWPRDDARWFWILGSPLSFWNHIPWLYAGNPELDRSTYLTCFRRIWERSSGRRGRRAVGDAAGLGREDGTRGGSCPIAGCGAKCRQERAVFVAQKIEKKQGTVRVEESLMSRAT